ncbi:MAG: TRAP transporter substrate-binding protein [Geminicoccaceae bacterium]|nr:TRAP transporter substrate-binding protein [Geminicoccaceae bacterium]
MSLDRRKALGAGLGLAGAAAAGGMVAAPSVVRAQTPVRWRMVTSWPRNLPGPGVTAQRLADRITAMSGGGLEIELFAAGEIVPAFEVMDAVSGEVAEMGHTAAVFWSGKMPAAPFFLAVPFGLTPLEHVAWIEQGGGQALWDELYGDYGVKPFLAGNTGMSMGGWFKNEIYGLADLKGLKFRMPGLGGEMYAPFGVVQVSLPPGEVLPALQGGVIDATEFAGPSSDLALGFHKAAPFYYGPGIHEPNGSGECIVNRAAFESLPPSLAAIVENACRAEAAFALAEGVRRNAAALRSLVNDHGVQLRTFPSDVIAALRESAGEVMAGFAARGGIEKRIHDSYTAMLGELAPWSEVSLQSFLGARSGRACS